MHDRACVRCGWVEGQPPLNCNNDDTPHVFPRPKMVEIGADEPNADPKWPDDFRGFGISVQW